MNREQLQALLWLNWRLRVNRLKRAGLASEFISIALAALAALFAVGQFAASVLLGWLALGDASATMILLVWDGVALAFLVGWSVGLMTELQRSDGLLLDKLLHLPVSPAGAFGINYLGSLFNLTTLVFAPAMCGLGLGLVAARGAAMLWLAPLLASFFLLVTAVSYQFQGWLAALMVNKRRRRTVVMLASVAFFLIVQGSVWLTRHWGANAPADDAARLTERKKEFEHASSAREVTRLTEQIQDLEHAVSAGEITAEESARRIEEYSRRFEELNRDIQTRVAEREMEQKGLERKAWLVSLLFPPGWLPIGAMSAADGKPAGALLATLGMTLIGAFSLWRSYRTTLGIYLGAFGSGRPAAAGSSATLAAAKPAAAATAPLLVEWRIPWLSEPAAAVATYTFRSLMRAPEIRMLLLTPLLMSLVLGPTILRLQLPPAARPLLGFGAFAFLLLTLGQLAMNQFGFDRGGFQALVLSGVRRRDVLLGKNLALAPGALAFGALAAAVVQALAPLRIVDFLALPFHFVSMVLLYCLLGNWMSIMAPISVPAGTLRRPKLNGIALLLHFAFGFMVIPFTMALTLLPLGVQWAAEQLDWNAGIPIYLPLSAAECVAVGVAYFSALNWQGELLQAREQAIFAIVKPKAE